MGKPITVSVTIPVRCQTLACPMGTRDAVILLQEYLRMPEFKCIGCGEALEIADIERRVFHEIVSEAISEARWRLKEGAPARAMTDSPAEAGG